MTEMYQSEANAELLVQALPYIRRFHNKTIVVKYGGNAMTDPQLKKDVMKDIVLLSLVGLHIVVVHGGGPEISDLLGRLGKESRFVGGLRYTDQETLDVVQEVLCGKVNKDLVSLINRVGGKAVGLSGMDAGLLSAEKLVSKGDCGFVGNVTTVDASIVNDLLTQGYIPVVSTVAEGTDDETHYNVNADTAAAKLAAALKAEKLVLLTDVRGIFKDRNDPETLISQVSARDVPKLISEGVVKGGMIPKVECCIDALAAGVHQAHIIDGTIRHSLLIELLSDSGIGTMVKVG